MNIKVLQIQQLPQRHPQQRILSQCRYTGQKKHLHKQITTWYRYIRHQKSKSFIVPLISITIHQKARKDYAIQRIGVGLARRSWAGVHSLFLLRGHRELNSNFPLYTTQNSCYGIPTSSETFFSLNFLSRKALISGFDFWNIIRYEKRCFWQVDNRRFLYYFHFSSVFFVVSLSLH